MDAAADGFIDLGVLKPVAFSRELMPVQVPVGSDGFPDLTRLPEGRSDYAPASTLEGRYVPPSDFLSDLLEAAEVPTGEDNDAQPLPEFDGAISLSDLPDGAPSSSFGLIDTVAETRAADENGGGLSQKLAGLVARGAGGDSITEELPGSAYRLSAAPPEMTAPSLPAKDSEVGVDAFTHLFGSTGAVVEEVLLLAGGGAPCAAESYAMPSSSVTSEAPRAGSSGSPLLHAVAPERPVRVVTGGVPDPAAFLPEAESHAEAARRFAALTPARAALPPRLRAMMADGLSGLLASLGAPPLVQQLTSAGLDAAAAAAAAAALVVDADEVGLDGDDIVAAQSEAATPPLTSASSATESAPGAEIPGRVAASTRPGPSASAGRHQQAQTAPGHAAPFRIAVCQVHSVQGDIGANINALCTVLRSLSGREGNYAAEKDGVIPGGGGFGTATPLADLVVFPETFLTGYHVGPALLRELAVPLPSDADIAAAVAASRYGGPGTSPEANPLLRVACAAAEHGIAVCLPYAEVVPAADVAGGAAPVYNSVSVFDTDGAVVAHYRKSHLWVPSASPALLSDGAPPPAYESAAFVAGPGPAVTHSTLRYGLAPPSTGDPFVPFTLSARPDLPIGLLVCFDCEFPEPARALALRGARVIVGVVASGEAGGFTSRVLVPARAAENGVCFAWCNFPSMPLPLWTTRPAPADALVGAGCSGGSAVFGPDGRPLCALPAYASAPHRREGGATEEAWGEPACVDTAAGVGATLALQQLRGPEGRPRPAKNSAAPMAHAGDISGLQADDRGSGHVALPGSALLPPGSPCLGVSDEVVFVVALSPAQPRYSDSARRNPYLTARRPSLFGNALAGRIAGPNSLSHGAI